MQKSMSNPFSVTILHTRVYQKGEQWSIGVQNNSDNHEDNKNTLFVKHLKNGKLAFVKSGETCYFLKLNHINEV